LQKLALAMLILPLKPAVRFDLQTALSKWLDSDQEVSFQPSNPLQFVLPKPDLSAAACREDLLRLQSLRNCVTDVLLKRDSHRAALEDDGLADCHEYHATLLEFEKRGFPTLDDEHNGLRLFWKGAWSPEEERHATLTWDRAVIEFNTAALLTGMAAECSVTDRAACKEAVNYCQTAASILAVLKELVQSMDFATVDLSQPMLAFWEKYLVAQAQMFIYRMAAQAGDDTKHSTLSVLSQSAFALFNEALTAAQDPRLESEVPKESSTWATYCKVSSMLSVAKAEYHQAVVHRLANEWGKEIARLRDCHLKFETLSKFVRGLDDDGPVSYMRRECLAILPVVHDRLHEADKDNYNIYQEKIPKEMPEIAAKQLAKSSGGLPQSMLVPKKQVFVNV
jgi:hypothetical protein